MTSPTMSVILLYLASAMMESASSSLLVSRALTAPPTYSSASGCSFIVASSLSMSFTALNLSVLSGTFPFRASLARDTASSMSPSK